MENKELVEKLMEKYLRKDCTQKEILRLLEYFDQPENEEALKLAINRYFEDSSMNEVGDRAKETAAIEDVHTKLMSHIGDSRMPVRKMNWYRVSAAASLLVLVSLTSWFIYNYSGNRQKFSQQGLPVNGGTREILTYLDTTRMPLSSRNIETVATKENNNIKSNNKQGHIAISESLKVGTVSYNKVTIPRGGQYELILPDGTRVWLNAASTIAFPDDFTDKERRVRITGEVYFEVAPQMLADNSGKVPFIVSANKTEIRVLGTHFNVNAYPDGKGTVKTTLAEGSVEVSSTVSKQKSVIKPGQQAVTSNTGEMNVKEVNLEEVMAWKNGYFYFDNSNLRNIMQDLSRWYDVRICYDENIPERRFSGKIQKDLSLNEVIELLKYTNVNIKIENDCIIVTQ